MEFLLQCWKSANEWNIVSTREEKFRIKKISFKSQMVGPLDFWKEVGIVFVFTFCFYEISITNDLISVEGKNINCRV